MLAWPATCCSSAAHGFFLHPIGRVPLHDAEFFLQKYLRPQKEGGGPPANPAQSSPPPLSLDETGLIAT